MYYYAKIAQRHESFQRGLFIRDVIQSLKSFDGKDSVGPINKALKALENPWLTNKTQ